MHCNKRLDWSINPRIASAVLDNLPVKKPERIHFRNEKGGLGANQQPPCNRKMIMIENSECAIAH